MRRQFKALVFEILFGLAKWLRLTGRLRAVNALKPIVIANENVVILAPHPDDEIIGCASIIESDKNRKGETVVLLATGTMERANESKLAILEAGPRVRVVCCGHEDGSLTQYENILSRQVGDMLRRLDGPTTLFIPYQFDFHADHIAAHFAGKKVFIEEPKATQCYCYRTNHANVMTEFDSYSLIKMKKKKRLYRHFLSQAELDFVSLTKIRQYYFYAGDDIEAELFQSVDCDPLAINRDIRIEQDFSAIEGRVSDIHPYRFLVNQIRIRKFLLRDWR